jgi:hypothetical protein
VLVRTLKILLAVVVLALCIPSQAIVVCFDYVYWRVFGTDPMPPIPGKPYAKGAGIGVEKLRQALRAAGYRDFDISITAHEDPAKAQSHLHVGDVIILGDAHTGIVATADGLIDHYLQVYGQSGIYRPVNDKEHPLPKANKDAKNPEGKGGLYLGETLAIFLDRPFRPDPNAKVVVWRKR